jgi:hypothetical protein
MGQHPDQHSPSSAPDSLRKGVLYDSLFRLGNIFELDFSFNTREVADQLEPFEASWSQYNPLKPKNPRQGLSITSLDGELSGTPDLHSLREYNKEHGTKYRERDFRTFTRAFRECPVIHPLIKAFDPHWGRTHFLRFGAGGYFPPHRDGAAAVEPDVFRILVPMAGVHRSSFVFLYNDERIILEAGATYVINTLVSHSIFSFAPTCIFVGNIDLTEESVQQVKSCLSQR